MSIDPQRLSEYLPILPAASTRANTDRLSFIGAHCPYLEFTIAGGVGYVRFEGDGYDAFLSRRGRDFKPIGGRYATMAQALDAVMTECGL
jgi:hypothetical protein